MIQLGSKTLSTNLQSQLDALQNQVNLELTFAGKAAKAKSLWNSKPKDIFGEIKEHLIEIAVSVEICNYCEHNEGYDIEHIYPKSFYPEKAFQWENYLLACKTCNSAYKLDKCNVIGANNDIEKVSRGSEPHSSIGAFINLRAEDPTKFLFLELNTFKYCELPNLSKIDKNKAISTREILALNERDTLLHTRQQAYNNYFDKVDRLVKILQAKNIETIEYLLRPNQDKIDTSLSIAELKLYYQNSFRKEIQTHQHPSVWHSIKLIESKINKKWQELFNVLPEMLTW